MPDDIRPAVTADLDALVDIERAVFVPPAYEPMSRRQFHRHLASPRADLFVAEHEGRAVGYALGLARAGGRYLRFYSIAVLPEARGGAIGRRLFEAIEAAARRRGLGVLLEIRADNDRLHRRYLDLGYTVFETRPGYYPDGCAAIRLRKSFTKR